MENKIIFETHVGSRLYGLSNENSDIDYYGVVLPTKEQLYGFGDKKFTIDLSFIDKDKYNKNTKEAIDRKMVSLHEFLKNCMKCSPNVLEVLFTYEDAIVSNSDIGKMIFSNRERFINDQATKNFKGFIRSQKKALMTIPIKKKALKEAISFLNKIEDDKEPLVIFEKMEGFNKIFQIKKNNGNQMYSIVGTPYLLTRGITVKRAKKDITKNTTKSNRDELIEKCGYDCKSAYHMIRLLLEYLDLIKYRKIFFPFSGNTKEMLLDIKRGDWTIGDIISYAEDLESQAEVLLIENPLPKADFDWLEIFVIELLEKEM